MKKKNKTAGKTAIRSQWVDFFSSTPKAALYDVFANTPAEYYWDQESYEMIKQLNPYAREHTEEEILEDARICLWAYWFVENIFGEPDYALYQQLSQRVYNGKRQQCS